VLPGNTLRTRRLQQRAGRMGSLHVVMVTVMLRVVVVVVGGQGGRRAR